MRKSFERVEPKVLITDAERPAKNLYFGPCLVLKYFR